MSYRTNEIVRMSSGFISYRIQIRKWFGWVTFKTFTNRKDRDEFYLKIIKTNETT